jgi:hypothetical protein
MRSSTIWRNECCEYCWVWRRFVVLLKSSWVMAASDRGPNQPNRVGAICLRSVARHNGILQPLFSAAGVRAPPRGGGQVFVSCAHSCFPSPLRVVVVVFARRSWPPLRSPHAACARRYQVRLRPFARPSGESTAAELRRPSCARGKPETRQPSPLFAISGDFSAAAAVGGFFGFSSNSEEHA